MCFCVWHGNHEYVESRSIMLWGAQCDIVCCCMISMVVVYAVCGDGRTAVSCPYKELAVWPY